MLNDSNLWCEDCERSNEGECSEHGPLVIVNDSPITSRARQSLPHILTLNPNPHGQEGLAVYSREPIKKRTRFGPLQARKSRNSRLAEGIISFKLFREGQDPICLNTTDEKYCNWMVFVRPAFNFNEQNLVAFQYQAHIYFVTIKDIAPGTELKVWYAKEYAFSMETKPLSKNTGDESLEVERSGRQLRPRGCPRCHRRFASPQDLESHHCIPVMASTSQEPATVRRERRKAKSPPSASSIAGGSSPRRSKAKAEENVQTRAMQRAATSSSSTGGSGEGGEASVAGPSTSKVGPRVHHCTLCEKSFSSPGKLYQHMYSHTGERPFACSECSKAFSSKFKLMRHLLIHSADRKHQCQFCERSFHRKDHLKNHSKVHNPDKKVYRCEKESCRKEYNSYLSYRKHVAVHAAEDGGLDCKICGRSFTNREEILYHLKVHAGSRTVKNPSEKKFQCDLCERRFFTRKDVKRHLVVHTGKRDFLCQFCPQRFGRKDHLVRHIKKSHGGRARTRRDAVSSASPSEIFPQPSTSRAVPEAGPSGSQRRTRRGGFSRQLQMGNVEIPSPSVPTGEQPMLFQDQPPPYSDYKLFPGQMELGIKIEEEEEEDEATPDPSGMDLNQLLHLAGSSEEQHILDPICLIDELSAASDNPYLQQLMEQTTPSVVQQHSQSDPSQATTPNPPMIGSSTELVSTPADSTPLPRFNQVFQQQQQPPPPSQ